MTVFRRPSPGEPVGDAIPFAHDGDYHLFFLSAPSEDSSWLHWRTRDFVTWDELPVAVAADAEQGAAWTGSVVERDGVFHLFYTGSLVGSETPQRSAVPPVPISSPSSGTPRRIRYCCRTRRPTNSVTGAIRTSSSTSRRACTGW